MSERRPAPGPKASSPDRNAGSTSRLGALAPLTEAVFHTASRLRRARAFHPRGTAFRARAHVPEEPLLPPGLPVGDHDAIVRLSRGLGLPEPAPDVLGIGLRLLDAGGPGDHQDLLLASSWASPVGRRLLRPARSFSSGAFSTLLPYRFAGERILFGARVLGAGPGDVVLSWATLLGPWRPLGTVALGAPLPAEEEERLDLHPFHTVPGLVPVGWLNELRRPAYAASRAGRHETGNGAP